MNAVLDDYDYEYLDDEKRSTEINNRKTSLVRRFGPKKVPVNWVKKRDRFAKKCQRIPKPNKLKQKPKYAKTKKFCSRLKNVIW